MIILTAANSDQSKDDIGKPYEHFSFIGVIQKTIKIAIECGYKPIVYDLGSLGIGKPFNVNDETFNDKGYYEREVKKGYKSKSLFKPKMVKMCLEEYNEFTVYLDGDAQLCSNIDEITEDDYDIGVTLRDSFEFKSDWYKEHFKIVKYLNAGVIFFNNTPEAKSFISKWQTLTEDVGNDQMALNQLACPENYPLAYSVHNINGVRVKYFPCSKYNFYYFNKQLAADIKIMHFKGSVRHFYPFDWKKRLYCNTLVPARNIIRFIVKECFASAK